MSYTRQDNRTHDQIRNTKITPNISPYAEGSDWHLPGAPYLLSTVLLLVGAATAWRATKPM